MLLLFVFFFNTSWCFIHSDENVKRDSLVKCILKGEELYGEPLKPIFLSLPISEQDPDEASAVASPSILIDNISVYKKWSLIVANITKADIKIPKDKRASTIDNYIIYFRHSGEFRKSIYLINKLKVLNPHANFIIVTTTYFKNDNPIIMEIFEVLKEFQILKSVLLIGSSENISIFNLYSLIPFKDGTCRHNVQTDTKLIDTCSHGNYTLNTKWYDFDIPKIFKSCTLKVVYTEVPPYVLNMKNKTVLSSDELTSHGLEVGIVANIFAYMNVSLIFIKSDLLGDIDSDGNGTGALGKLLKKETDLAIGGFAMTSERMISFDVSFPYIFDNLVWIVPHEHLPLAEFLGLATIIHSDVWIVIALLIVITGSMIIILANHTSEESSGFKRPGRAIQNLLTTMLNITVGILPKSHRVRMIFSMVLVFAVIYNGAYTTYLTSVIAKSDRYREKYHDVSDIDEQNLGIYIIPYTERVFKINTTIHYKLVRRSKYCRAPEFNKCLEEVARYRNASFLSQRGYVEYVRDNYLSASHTRLLKILPTSVMSYQVNFFMVKGFWGLERVNHLLGDAVASGLAEKWMRISKNTKLTNGTVIVENAKIAKGTTTLTFKNLVFLFYLILAGNAVAITVFVAEVIIHKYQDNDRVPSGKLGLLTWPQHTLYQ